jgi:thiol:disulfide interchange protein
VVRATAYWRASGVQPGGKIDLAIVLTIDKPWKINGPTPREGLIPTRLWVGREIPKGTGYAKSYLKPEKVELAGEKLHAYKETTTIYVTVTTSADTPVGTHRVPISVEIQACKTGEGNLVCLNYSTITLQPELIVVDADTPVQPTHDERFAQMAEASDAVRFDFFGRSWNLKPSLAVMIAMALLGGFMLNLTPCVLPVIPIKIMSLAASADNRARCLMLGAATSGGVLAFWLGIGAAIAISVSLATGDDIGFGSSNQLFQYPLFTIGVGIAIAVMAVGMCGLFAVQLPKWVYKINPSHDTILGSVGMGVMTAVLSTPCTAPFMGSAAAWAATRPAATTLVVFAAIGTGMAIPYFVLAAFPKLVQKMPRTGPASELIKQIMGLLMLAAAFYFVGTGIAGMIVDPPDPPSRLYWWAVALVIAGAGGWLAYRTIQLTPSSVKRGAFGGFGVLLVLIGVMLGVKMTDKGPIDWTYYTPDRMATVEQGDQAIVLEFTADWCINCLALERTVLHDPRVVALLNDPAVMAMKVDLTGNNKAGNRKLIAVGRRTIPLLIIYKPNGEEVFRSDAYTVNQIVEAITTARGGAKSAAGKP